MVTYSIRGHIYEIIAKFFDKEIKDVRDVDTMKILGAGDVYLLEELVYIFEDAFGIKFRANEEIAHSMTVDNIIEFILKRKARLKNR